MQHEIATDSGINGCELIVGLEREKALIAKPHSKSNTKHHNLTTQYPRLK